MTITDGMVEAFRNGLYVHLCEGCEHGTAGVAWAECCVSAGLEAVVPLIRAQALRDHAENRHGPNLNRLPMTVFGGASIPFCLCGAPWREDGCTPRQQLLAAADLMEQA